MAEVDTASAEKLLSRVEVAAGEITPRDANAPLIKEIIEAVGALRSLLGVDRMH